jgi:cell division protein FtsX
MAVVISNAIGITVRERTKEIAVLKVLGFSPGQILVLILGEGLMLGICGGFFGVALPHLLVNYVFKGIRLPLGFFPIFFVPTRAYYWGPLDRCGNGTGGKHLAGDKRLSSARGRNFQPCQLKMA